VERWLVTVFSWLTLGIWLEGNTGTIDDCRGVEGLINEVSLEMTCFILGFCSDTVPEFLSGF